MKQAMWGIGVLAIIVLGLVALITNHGRDIRESEMEKSLSAAVDAAVEQMSMEGKYTIADDKELIADFSSLLVEQLNVSGTKEQMDRDGNTVSAANPDKNLALTVDIAGVDAKHGLLSVHVTEEFTHPNGKIGKIETTGTIVLEQEEGRKVYEISYLIPEEERKQALDLGQAIPSVYKRYIQEEGEAIRAPKNPPNIGNKRFVAWVDADGATYTSEQLKTMKADKALSLSAVYN